MTHMQDNLSQEGKFLVTKLQMMQGDSFHKRLSCEIFEGCSILKQHVKYHSYESGCTQCHYFLLKD